MSVYFTFLEWIWELPLQVLAQALAPFSVKSQTVNILVFSGCVVSLATTQLCQYVQRQPWMMLDELLGFHENVFMNAEIGIVYSFHVSEIYFFFASFSSVI